MKKTRVLIFGLTSLIGGVETYIINLVRNIDREKFEIDFLIQDDITGINKERIDGYYNNFYKVENLKKHPIKALKRLKKIYKENNYDVAHLNISTASSALYALPAKIYSKKTNIIVHSHNGGDKNVVQHYFFRKILNLIADKYLACSKLAAEWMFGSKIANSMRVTITNNAIETERFLYNKEKRDKIRKELNLTNNFVIGHVGRFNQQKNHSGMIEIFKEVLKKDKDIKLMLLGTGELEENIKEKVKEYKIQDNVLFLGIKQNVNDYYQAMDVFILPSNFEGLPIVGVEAQASGIKCLFSENVTKETDITGNVEFISINDTESWVKSIVELKASNYFRENQKDNFIKNGYDLKEEIHKIENIYEAKEMY